MICDVNLRVLIFDIFTSSFSLYVCVQQSRGIVSIVLGLGGGVVLFSIIRSLTSFNLTVRASKRLHDTMTSSVLRAKVEFFDTNPSGRCVVYFL